MYSASGIGPLTAMSLRISSSNGGCSSAIFRLGRAPESDNENGNAGENERNA
jgi:hypothetical protein